MCKFAPSRLPCSCAPTGPAKSDALRQDAASRRGARAGEAASAAGWVRALRIRRAAVFLGPCALADNAGLQALAAAGRVDLWLLVPIAPTDDAAADERAIIGGLRAIFPPQGVHPAGLRLLRPDGARFLLAFASADRNARGQALGLKAAEFLIQGARRGAPPTPPAPPCRSPRDR